MVHINQVELTHFKSFGGSITIPLQEGFTVVTGPNGSGKSNILDAVLFCLGLASSRGMRADRLPDLINSAMLREGKAAETSVSVRFDLSEWQPDQAEAGLEPPEEGPWIKPGQQEWTVSRRLRVAPGGTYASSFSADGVSCNLQQLQSQLRRLRVDPEGSNVVMQGDVTRIVSMSARDRRGIIDELAGVALFDSRIEQSRGKLDEVQERQERCSIVQQELLSSRQKLERDCAKARTYQDLRQRHHNGRLQEQVLAFEAAQASQAALLQRSTSLASQQQAEREAISEGETGLTAAAAVLEQLQAEVKALGEDQLIAVQAELAGLEASGRELTRQAGKHQLDAEALQHQRHELARTQGELRQQQQALEASSDQAALNDAEAGCRAAEAAVELSRRRLGEVAGRSGSWLEDQQQRSRARQQLGAQIGPLEAERQQLQERLRQHQERLAELGAEEQQEGASHRSAQEQLEATESSWQQVLEATRAEQQQMQELAESLALQQRTRSRLEQEQIQLEREIARLDSRRETLQESRGTGALRVLLEAGMDGIHGPVAQLGEVEERVRLALEVAAGGRLGQVVVDDDRIAARAIELLKSRRAGRLTFLPLNKIRGGSGGGSSGSGGAALQRGGAGAGGSGLIGKAVDLVGYEPVYAEVFRYVFGDTLVFDNLANARRELGRCRAVTLDGELLEKSGAMTGGSLQQRGSQLSFGRSQDGDEAEPLRQRLLELGESLLACRRKEAQLGQRLEALRPRLLEHQQRQAGLEAERSAAQRALAPQLQRQQQLGSRLGQLQQALQSDLQRQQQLDSLLLPLQQQRISLEEAEAAVQSSGDAARWQGLQSELEAADTALAAARSQRDWLLAARRERALSAERLSNQLEALSADEQRLVAAVNTLVAERTRWKEQHQADQERRSTLAAEQQQLQTRFGESRRARDAAEAQLAAQRQALQQRQWKLQRLGEEIESLAEQQRGDQLRLAQLERELPEPLPEIPEEVRQAGLEALQAELRSLQARMEALEPVNMLALEELEQLETRLAELEERLEVLSKEREELLLRIETVATLRQEAFLEAFTAVDGHFRTIFEGLSDGEGHLQLENPEAPLEGGLTLVAHPKGKAVRRLNSMSGGEKSLTALSFLFALQRFRPSPFYALDEVDSFLDGVNVERLAALIAGQADQAQFMVVSHRRPMIAAATRTIGVTQARGAHTQVVGLPPAT
ncbi:MAG: chromosome segregation protein SMC [Prochlorococcaceae cyanobacterium MAG_34]|nr:MAG: chromosome partitioning protein ParA [cyanobacterium BACL30 MAG-120619-bin27]MDP4682725.1 chromosome segregation protein SMC [Cyanobium sp. MAG_255]MDP4738322.1 chromosome segregation protein SMC [Cyanobium sp. MAG_216]MDP4808586.1 chromosome segregation protein SMC [Cyanobium sp. MAG_160]MDP4831991.1 chromosome segregation protein SMC [Cyanobium sp. MAG_185]MDP4948106.1 chromosome segregation protein SMC [Cyanobium sp. MAG_102]MDP5118095.1 chromosome segregation protein SMC [Prochlor